MTSARKRRLEKGLLKLGEVADEAGVRPSTVKFYTMEGLLDPVVFTRGGHRLYERESTVQKIITIRQMTSRKCHLSELRSGGSGDELRRLVTVAS
ncbi:MAG: MerR family transcriptional regulator [bacterium]